MTPRSKLALFAQLTVLETRVDGLIDRYAASSQRPPAARHVGARVAGEDPVDDEPTQRVPAAIH